MSDHVDFLSFSEMKIPFEPFFLPDDDGDDDVIVVFDVPVFDVII